MSVATVDPAGAPVLESAVRALELATTLTIIPEPGSGQRLCELTRLDRLLPFSHRMTDRRDHVHRR